MFCEYCGIKIEENAQFCQSCGKKSDAVFNKDSSSIISNKIVEGDDVFYSEEWKQKKIIAIVLLPYFDVMVDGRYLYIIKIPGYSGATIGFILGFFILSFIGAVIGSLIGESSDAKKRKHYRLSWVNSSHKIISCDYNKDIFLKMPLENLKNNIIFNEKRFTLIYGEKEIVLQKNKEEISRFNKHVEKYVL